MPVDPLPRILPAAISSFVGPRAASKGLASARSGAVGELTWDPAKHQLRAEVTGTAPEPYAVRVRLGEYDEQAVTRRFLPESPGGLWKPVSALCTCPVSVSCKHAAAVLYRLNELSEQAERDSAEQVSEWRSALRPLLQEPESSAEPAPLALRFELEASPLEDGRRRYSHEPATSEHIRAGSELRLGMRPMLRGKQGRWIKGGISWRTFEYRVPGRGYVAEHAEALTRIFSAATAERTYTTGAVEHLWLGAIGSPMMWQALAYAAEVGVAFLPSGVLSSVELAEPAAVEIDLAASEGQDDLAVRPRIIIGAHEAPAARPLGTSGVIDLISSEEEGDARSTGRSAQYRARLASVDSPIPTALQRLFHREEPLRVPSAEREEFLRSAYPRLRQVAPVTSADGSVEMPAIEPATLQVTAAYAPGDELTLSWSWRYHDPDRTLAMDQSTGVRRDIDHEEEVLARARELWPTAGAFETERLGGVDTAHFSEHVLDALDRLDHVSCRITGTRHAYRELDGAPHVRITQQESAGKNDWFDLGFEITIEGRQIAFSDLFKALASGQSRLLMPDRTYFSLDNPAFDQLRELIAEGEALAEWDPEQQSISKYQVDLWNDLEEIAQESVEATGWEQSVGALRGGADPSPVPAPAGLTAELRPYQEEGFSWLAFLYDHRLGGVLADDMGLGKTVQTLALIAHARESSDARAAGGEGPAAPFLVVAPSSVLSVWRAEAQRFTPGLDLRVVDRTRRSRGGNLAEEIAGADVVVTSYTVLRIDAEEFAERSWDGMVLDEAQFVKNRRSRTHQAAKGVRAGFRLAITGTPMENSLDDLWSILSLATPGLFGAAAMYRQRYTMPIESGEHPERMETLRRRLKPFMLRRTKDLVAPELPPKQEQVWTVQLSPDHRAVYDALLQRERKKVLGLIEDDLDRNRFIVFRSLTLLRMMALDPAIVDDDQHHDVPSSKLSALFDQLDEVLGNGHRVLLFSQFTSYLHRVAQELQQRGVTYAYLDGSTRDREQVVQQFREGEAPVFLISLKAGGFGLTLTEADYVFLLDPWWNPAAENQAVDRAHRIGQDRHVMVYRMVAEDTIEEKVLALQRKKADLFDALTDSDTAFRQGITAEDIRELLE